MDMTREYSDIELKRLIVECVDSLLTKIPMVSVDRKHLVEEVFNGRRRTGII